MTNTDRFSKEYLFVIIAMCGLSAGAVGALINAAGVFFSPMAADLGVGKGSVSLTLTIVSLMAATVGLFIPKLLKEKSWRLIIIIGTITMVGSTIGQAFVNSLMLIYLLNVIKGVGAGLLQLVTITAFVNNWFYAKHGFITSLTMCFSGVAGALLSSIVASVISSFGWRVGYIVVGIAMLIFCLPSILLPISLSPKTKGLEAYGAHLKQENKTTSETQTSNTNGSAFFLVCATAICANVIIGVAQHLPSYAVEIGYSSEVVAFLLSLALIGNISSKLAIGSIADIVGTKNAMLITTVLNFISLVLLLLHTNPLLTHVGGLLFGCTYGIAAVGITLMTKNLFGNQGFVKVYPVVSFIGTSSNAFASSAIGYLFD